MKNRLILASALSAFAFSGVASAAGDGSSGSGNLTVTADVAGSINLTFSTDTGNGVSLTGSTTSTATLPFGSVTMYGYTPATGITQTINGGTTSFSLATPFNVHAELANSSSATYTLAASLTSSDIVNTWVLSTGVATPVPITSTPGPVNILGAYASDTVYTLKLTVPASEAAGIISNTIAFTASAN